jgi:hypothetical protein
MNQPSDGPGVSLDTVRLVVSSFIEAMRAFEGERFQQQLAETACVGLSWIVEDHAAGVNAPEWPALCEELLAGIRSASPPPEGFAEALRGYAGFPELSSAAMEIAAENRIDLKEFSVALRHAGELAHRVAAIKKAQGS